MRVIIVVTLTSLVTAQSVHAQAINDPDALCHYSSVMWLRGKEAGTWGTPPSPITQLSSMTPAQVHECVVKYLTEERASISSTIETERARLRKVDDELQLWLK